MDIKKTNPIMKFKEEEGISWLYFSRLTDLTPNTLSILSKKTPEQLLKTTPLETYFKLKQGVGIDLLELDVPLSPPEETIERDEDGEEPEEQKKQEAEEDGLPDDSIFFSDQDNK